MNFHRATPLLLGVLACCLGGCSQTVPVSGKVVIDGKAAENIAVLFQGKPVKGVPIETAVGKTDSSGMYSLHLMTGKSQGAFPGDYSVYLAWKDPKPDPNLPEGSTASSCPYKIPTRATNGSMKFTVPPEGTKEADFIFDSEKESFAPSEI